MPKGHGLDPTVVEREARAIALANDGLRYEDIGEALGVSKGTAWKIVQRGLLRTLDGAGADRYRQRQLDRIEELVRSLWNRANGEPDTEGGTPPAPLDQDRAVLGIVRLFDREARLRGLDAPVEITLTESAEERAARIAERWRAHRSGAIDTSSREVGREQVNGNGKAAS